MNLKKFLRINNSGASAERPEGFEEIEALFKKYRAVDTEKDGDIFERELLQKLQKAETCEPVKKSRNFMPVFVFSAVAAIVLILGFYFYGNSVKSTESEPELVSSSEVEKGEPVKITIEFESDEDIENVVVSFALDKNVRFYSENEKIKNLDSYKWFGSFRKGVNSIPFVVSLVSDGESKIVTETGFGGYLHSRTIILKTGHEKTAVFVYKSKKVLSEL